MEQLLQRLLVYEQQYERNDIGVGWTTAVVSCDCIRGVGFIVYWRCALNLDCPLSSLLPVGPQGVLPQPT